MEKDPPQPLQIMWFNRRVITVYFSTMPQHFELSVRPLGHLPHPTNVQDTSPPCRKLKLQGLSHNTDFHFPPFGHHFPFNSPLRFLARVPTGHFTKEPSHGSLRLDEPSWQSCYQGPNLNKENNGRKVDKKTSSLGLDSSQMRWINASFISFIHLTKGFF